MLGWMLQGPMSSRDAECFQPSLGTALQQNIPPNPAVPHQKRKEQLFSETVLNIEQKKANLLSGIIGSK